MPVPPFVVILRIVGLDLRMEVPVLVILPPVSLRVVTLLRFERLEVGLLVAYPFPFLYLVLEIPLI